VQVFLIKQVLNQSEHVDLQLDIFLVVAVGSHDLQNSLPVINHRSLTPPHQHVENESLGSLFIPVFEVILQLIKHAAQLNGEQI